MQRALALIESPSLPIADGLRMLIVCGSALALILAGKALPF
ncbi:hypothetical protein [Novosphingobium lentum]|nr:hypothetical protein [Novosphingobium lentum]